MSSVQREFLLRMYSAEVLQLYRRVELTVARAPSWLGRLGMNGLTAWVGPRPFGRVRAGDTVLVITAAGLSLIHI